MSNLVYKASIEPFKRRIAELEAEKETWDGHKVCELLRKDIAELEADNERLRDENDAWQNQDLLEQSNKQADEIEKLRADCKDKQRLIETQKQYLDNKDSVIKGLNDMITKLEGDLEVMRLQRDATQVSRCPRCGETALQERE